MIYTVSGNVKNTMIWYLCYHFFGLNFTEKF